MTSIKRWLGLVISMKSFSSDRRERREEYQGNFVQITKKKAQVLRVTRSEEKAMFLCVCTHTNTTHTHTHTNAKHTHTHTHTGVCGGLAVLCLLAGEIVFLGWWCFFILFYFRFFSSFFFISCICCFSFFCCCCCYTSWEHQCLCLCMWHTSWMQMHTCNYVLPFLTLTRTYTLLYYTHFFYSTIYAYDKFPSGTGAEGSPKQGVSVYVCASERLCEFVLVFVIEIVRICFIWHKNMTKHCRRQMTMTKKIQQHLYIRKRCTTNTYNAIIMGAWAEGNRAQTADILFVLNVFDRITWWYSISLWHSLIHASISINTCVCVPASQPSSPFPLPPHPSPPISLVYISHPSVHFPPWFVSLSPFNLLVSWIFPPPFTSFTLPSILIDVVVKISISLHLHPPSPSFSFISFTTPSFSSSLPHCPFKVWWHSADEANPAKIIDYRLCGRGQSREKNWWQVPPKLLIIKYFDSCGFGYVLHIFLLEWKYLNVFIWCAKFLSHHCHRRTWSAGILSAFFVFRSPFFHLVPSTDSIPRSAGWQGTHIGRAFWKNCFIITA